MKTYYSTLDQVEKTGNRFSSVQDVSNGDIIQFEYTNADGERSNRTVYVIENEVDGALHGIDIQYVPSNTFSRFLKMTRDNSQFLDDSKQFYERVVKKFNFPQHPYRTFATERISAIHEASYVEPVLA